MARLTDERRRLEKFIEPFGLQPGSRVRLASAEELSPADVTERGIWDDHEAAHAAG